MLIKLLIFIAIVFLIYIFFFKTQRKEEISKQKSHSKKVIEGDTMVECHACSTFVSHDEAIIKDGHYFCSKECARLP